MSFKQFSTIVLASAVSSVVAVFAYQKFFPQKNTVQVVEQTPVKYTSFSTDVVGALQPVDFRYAAATTTPSVVHIKSAFKVEQVRFNQRDPMRDFFGDDFFRFFHGPSPMQNQPKVATGSGVIISEDGYIVTNNHVVENANEIDVTLHNNKTYKAKMIGRDADTDLALIKIEGDNFPAINFANSDSVIIGEWVMAVGNPFNLSSTVTAGIVSAKARSINILGQRTQGNSAIESFIQTDAAVNPGNSGGALVNIGGELIGINTAIASPTGSFAGYSFAVPSNIVKKVVFDLQKFGVTQRGFLGVQIRGVDDELAKKAGLEKPIGVYVDQVNEGSAGKEAGLQQKDIITKINGASVNSAPELQEQIARYRPGDKISVDLIRNGKIERTTVVLKNKYNTTATVDSNRDILGALGLEVEELSDKEKTQLGVESGVKVTNIKPGKIAEFTDIKKGFIITQVDDQPVNNINDFVNVLKSKNGKVLVEGIYPNKPMSYLYAFKM